MNIEGQYRRWFCRIAAVQLLSGLMGVNLAHAADNLSFKGNLVAQACTIRPGDEALEFELEESSTHFLYLNTRTPGESFFIHLEACDPDIAETVATTFTGNESAELPGLLALAAGSHAEGVAVGLETPAGLPLPLNKESEKQTLENGANVLGFKAYIKGEPRAIAEKSIKGGGFFAVSTFKLSYQ